MNARRPGQPALPPPPPYKPEMLIRLKIAMRAKTLRPAKKRKREKDDGEIFVKGSLEGLGKNSGTTKYHFNPLELN
jgi:CTD kinase subunit beta